MATFFKSDSSSNFSTGVGYSYDVFLSFRGEDTRKNFTDHLYNALVQAGIHTFRDDNELPRGEEISQQLIQAIEESRISIVVFSKGYASSTWCLNELAKIVECKNTTSQIVLPVFYDIEPSDIRKQKRSFAEAFKVHEELCKEEMEKVNKWRGALKEAANISGYALKHMANRHESTFIQNIVKDVSNKLNRKYLHVARHPVGIVSRVDNILDFLRTATNSVRIVGIHGMPGIGKTTIAKVVFNQLCNRFEGSCFLKNVAEKSKQHNGLVRLQEELLDETLKRNSWKINNEDRGINLIKERLYHKRVLVVLDDVEQQKEIDALVGEGSSFGVGSIIIITTRNQHLLNRFEVVVKYQAELLNEDESFQLFSWHAFGNTCPSKDFLELSNKVVDYSRGLPLALEILGCCLYKKDKIRWESVIAKLREIPNHNIEEKLRISFDSLDDDKLQNIFLDIACFFIGRGREYVAKVLEARYGYNLEDDLGTLIERSLMTINCSGEINMHDLLRDMGREIIRKMSPDDPGKRNRIWHYEEAWNVVIKQMGTKAIEGLALDVAASKVEPLSSKSFAQMKHLQLLKINGVHLIGRFKVLPKWLIWLCWHRCPLKSLPSDFELSNLVILDMQYSNIKELWKGTKILNKLKILNLSYCEDLAKTPNFLGLSNLEKLILKNCVNIVEVPQSIGHLKMLVFLNLEGCCRLKILSENICNVKSLETLNVSGCSQLQKLPERMDDIESLTELLADGIENEQFLSSIAHFKYVKKLSLRGYSSNQDSQSSTSSVLPRGLIWKALLPNSFAGWRFLRELKLGYRSLSEGAMNYVDFGSLTFLEELDLSGNKFLNLPSGIGCLPKLRVLKVSNCTDLLLISELPSTLEDLYADGCTSLERLRWPVESRLPIQSKAFSFLFLDGCKKLKEVDNTENVDQCLRICFDQYCYGSSENYKRLAEVLSGLEHHVIHFSNGDIPDWFSYRSEKSSLSFHLPLFLQGLVIWVVYESTVLKSYIGRIILKNKQSGNQFYKSSTLAKSVDGLTSWVNYVTPKAIAKAIEKEEYYRDELELYLEIRNEDENGSKVKAFGIHMILDKPDSFKESESEWEWDQDIDNLQETISSHDVEERDEIGSQTGTYIVIPKLYHHLHHPLLGSITFSTKEQWKSYLLMELPTKDIYYAEFWRYSLT